MKNSASKYLQIEIYICLQRVLTECGFGFCSKIFTQHLYIFKFLTSACFFPRDLIVAQSALN